MQTAALIPVTAGADPATLGVHSVNPSPTGPRGSSVALPASAMPVQPGASSTPVAGFREALLAGLGPSPKAPSLLPGETANESGSAQKASGKAAANSSSEEKDPSSPQPRKAALEAVRDTAGIAAAPTIVVAAFQEYPDREADPAIALHIDTASFGLASFGLKIAASNDASHPSSLGSEAQTPVSLPSSAAGATIGAITKQMIPARNYMAAQGKPPSSATGFSTNSHSGSMTSASKAADSQKQSALIGSGTETPVALSASVSSSAALPIAQSPISTSAQAAALPTAPAHAPHTLSPVLAAGEQSSVSAASGRAELSTPASGPAAVGPASQSVVVEQLPGREATYQPLPPGPQRSDRQFEIAGRDDSEPSRAAATSDRSPSSASAVPALRGSAVSSTIHGTQAGMDASPIAALAQKLSVKTASSESAPAKTSSQIHGKTDPAGGLSIASSAALPNASLGGPVIAGHKSIAASADLFSRMDAGSAPPNNFRLSPHAVAVGVNDPAHGWIEVRAEGLSGQVTASLNAASSSAHAALHAQLPEMAAYLAEREIGVRSLGVGDVAHSATSGFTSDANSGANPGTHQGPSHEQANNRESGANPSASGPQRSEKVASVALQPEGNSGLLPVDVVTASAHRISVRV